MISKLLRPGFFLTWTTLWCAASAASDPANQLIDVGYVKLQGGYIKDHDLDAWLGIRYAAPPTGNARWRLPQPIEHRRDLLPAAGTYNVTSPGPMCTQGNPAWQLASFSPLPTPAGVEDCLILDILAPSKRDPNEQLPVLLKIHGGGYTTGNSDYRNGFPLLQHTKGAFVFVSVQYRLGPYGFLASSEVRRGGIANAGLYDQRLSIEWVRKYISRFGGDPARITITGGSAGGGSVTAQMQLFGGDEDPPFRAVIAEYPWWQPFHSDAVLEAQYYQLLRAAKCTSLACLRTVPEADLAMASQQTFIDGYTATPRPFYDYGDFYYGPAVDGRAILGLPSREFAAGRFSNVPLLANRDRYEGYYFTNKSMESQAELVADLKVLFPSARTSFFVRLFQLYPRSDYNSTFYQRVDIFGDFIINCPTHWMLQAVSAEGLSTFKMVFNAGNQQHAATSDFLYNPTYDTNADANVTLARYMRDWYASFAIYLDPNRMTYPGLQGLKKPIWPAYGAAGETLFVNVSSIGQARDQDDSTKCKFWEGNYPITRNKL